jgi:plastocyanin
LKYKIYLSLGTLIVTVVVIALFFDNTSTTSINKIYSQAQENKVSIPEGASDPLNKEFYIPQEIEVRSGDTVVWTNDDSEDHTVTQGTLLQGQNVFDSGIFGTGKTFEHTFDKPGEFEYHCTIHPHMTGKVIVS